METFLPRLRPMSLGNAPRISQPAKGREKN